MGCVFSLSIFAAPLSQEPSRVIYQLYVRAFYDGHGPQYDGHGDFAGIVEKIPYFKELGVNTLLLMPIFYSTGNMGYIPRDYFKIDPAYGDHQILEDTLSRLHEGGFKVILDAPVNHISYDSAWFESASQATCESRDLGLGQATSKYCDYFYFVDDPCGTFPYLNWHKPWKYFESDCTAVWFRHPQYSQGHHRSQHTYATFFSVMPDLKFWDFELNSWNEPVVSEIENFFQYWTRLGVDGFRLDAAKHFVEGRDSNNNPLEAKNLELLARFFKSARQINPNVSFLGEIWADFHEYEPYLPNSLDMALDFPFMSAVRESVSQHYAESLKKVLNHFEQRQNEIGLGSRVVFSGNHDVTRLMSQWADNEEKLKMAHFLTLATPFIPLLYYGEELGMHGQVKRPDNRSDEEYVRTINAFPWRGDHPNLGFPGPFPVDGAPDNWRERNVIQSQKDFNSAWHVVKNILKIRKEFGVDNQTIFYLRKDLYGHTIGWSMEKSDKKSKAKCVGVMANLDQTHSYKLPISFNDSSCGPVRKILFQDKLVTNGSQLNFLELGPMGKVIYSND